MSRRTVRIAMVLLTVIGIGIASYVTYVHYAGIKPACTAGESCTKVQTSVYSELAGVPVALMGLIGYVAILVTLLTPESETTRLGTLILTLGGFGFSAYLTYRELFSIHAICEWCVTSAIVMTILMLVSVWRFLRAEDSAYDGPSRLESAEPSRAPRLGTN